MRFFQQLFLNIRFFYALSVVFIGYILSYFFPVIYNVIHALLCIIVLLLLGDIIYLYRYKVEGKRVVGNKLSNGDKNTIKIKLQSFYPYPIHCKIIDEIPIQFQIRNFNIHLQLDPLELSEKSYSLRPVERGVYTFGHLNVFIKSGLGFARRRFVFDHKTETKVYPSFLQLKQKAYLLSDAFIQQSGNTLFKRLGHSLEFEQIKEYTHGDDIRTINWKATAKRKTLMVNQFQEEKAQQVYAIIDRGRVMKMPFNGLSLLDYAINSSLFLLNVVSRREDKAGVLTFSNQIENRVVAEKRGNQLQLIQEALYKVKTDYIESNFGTLYKDVNLNIRQRSLLLIYTNFETKDALNRQLKYLKAIAKNHVVLVIFFSNTEITSMANAPAQTTKQTVEKVITQHTILEKKQMLKELNKHGIRALISAPEHLTTDVINAYLEIKNSSII